MTRGVVHLEDGSVLRPRGRDGWTLDGRTVIAEVEGLVVTITDQDTGAKTDHKVAAPPAAPPSAPPQKRKGDRTRWRTLNTFVDRVARHLDDAEQAVWFVVFRFTQDDAAEVRIQDIAGRVGKSARTVQRAVDRLIEVGLLERLKRGTRQGGPSRYRLEPDPSIALPRLQADSTPQRDTGDTLKHTPKHRRRDLRGAFTT